MENLKSNQNVADTLKKIETVLTKLDNPTNASAKKALEAILVPKSTGISDLVPFTGYYSMNTAKNAFFSIDTSEVFINYQLTQKITVKAQSSIVTVTVSLDGKTATSYTLDKGASFDGKNLIIPGVLQIALTRVFQDGQLVTFKGNIGSATVTGSTCFNPVELPVFIGDYKEVTTKKTILSVAEASIKFDFGKGLQNISIFSYNPAMYVVGFTNSGANFTLMLGTAAQKGLACFITDGQNNDFAVTIP